VNILLVEQLAKSYGEKELFSDITFGLEEGQKVALIARNGAGKTSLLNIIAGIDQPDEGNIVMRKGTRVAYLPQNPYFRPGISVIDALFESENEVIHAIKAYEHHLDQLRHADTPENHVALAEASHLMDSLSAWDYESRVKEILGKFNIPDLDQLVEKLSGGQRKKIALARALIEKVDLLILDEPTNHLDIEIIEWLEDFLQRQKLSLLLVTHDRYFLDNVCDEILELDQGRIFHYKGNYSYFVEKKAEREAINQVETERARNTYRSELEWMRRMPQARTTKSKARIDAFYDVKDKAFSQQDNSSSGFQVKMTRIGGKILEINNIFKSYSGLKLVDNFSYTFKRGEKIGIVGKNGVGKTTLLHLIAGKIHPDAGKITIGQTIIMGYYSQEGLEPKGDKRVIDLVKEIAEEVSIGKGGTISASNFLLHFNFPQTTQYNYYSSLSGGEKRRLFLIMQLIRNTNFLILDEPTNDLDIQTLQLLEDFLMQFEGCLILVSHDRCFLDKLADHVFVFTGNGKIKDYYGNYSDYYRLKLAEERKEKLKQRPAKPETEKSKALSETHNKPTYKQKLEFEKLEIEIEALEIEKSNILALMSSGLDDIDEITKLSQQFSLTEKTIEEKTDRWIDLSGLM
jgi:ABC transport system ATP-binding/permease protein